MAKKAVATFKAGTLKKMVKCIRMDKSPKTGAYVFTEQLLEERIVFLTLQTLSRVLLILSSDVS